MSVSIDSPSPSARKPQLVVADWLERQLPIELTEFAPASDSLLAFAHSPSYIKGVMAGAIENGFSSRDTQVAESLLWTNGSFVAAAEHVVKHGGFACSPTSGFHHAHYSSGGCFCTFNGLMVAARVLLDEHESLRVGILDMDFHYGDGTQGIIQKLGLDRRVQQRSGWSFTDSPTAVIDEIPDSIDELECDVLFYQAGADMHIDDPLGGLMTTEELYERDRAVFEHCSQRSLPCVWNLAGGYQVQRDGSIPVVLEIHRNTMIACLAAS